jgi:hemolysin activation/secretion protein
VRGSYPTQEAVYLSGSVKPSSFAYWFVDPDNKISTQENLHIKGDANLRGYIGQHLRGQNGFGININIPIPQLKMINLFCDIGNVWDNKFESLKYDLGIGIDLQFVRVDFPFYINKPINDEKSFAFRWLFELSF